MAAQLACAFRRGGVGAVDINVKKLVFSPAGYLCVFILLLE